MKRQRSEENASPQDRKARKVICWDADIDDEQSDEATVVPGTSEAVGDEKKPSSALDVGSAPVARVKDEARPEDTPQQVLNAQRETLSAAQAAAPSTAARHLAEVVQVSMFDAFAVARVVDGAVPSWNTCCTSPPPLRRTQALSPAE